MFDLLSPLAADTPAYGGPERRNAPPLPWHWLMAMLDEIDYGMLLLLDENQVAHTNHVARLELDRDHPLQLLGNEVRLRRGQDVAPLCEALADAARRGRRRLLALGEAPHRVSIAVVPLPRVDGRPATLLVLGKRQVCEDLSVHWFAQAHRLTLTETQVLKGLCTGLRPSHIAQSQGVAMSTVRTQISSIRAKTCASSIRELVRQVAVLPPLVSALRHAPA